MITCGSECITMCCFCKYYNVKTFQCDEWEHPVESTDSCDEFHCFRVKDDDND